MQKAAGGRDGKTCELELTGRAALSRRPTPTLDAQVLNRLRVQRTQLSWSNTVLSLA